MTRVIEATRATQAAPAWRFDAAGADELAEAYADGWALGYEAVPGVSAPPPHYSPARRAAWGRGLEAGRVAGERDRQLAAPAGGWTPWGDREG